MDAIRPIDLPHGGARTGNFRCAWMLGFWLALALAVAAHGTTQMASGRALDRVAMLMAVNGAMPQAGRAPPLEFTALEYAEVKREWLEGFMRRFRADLSRKNVPVDLIRGRTGWQERFDCVAFTELFVGNAHAELMVDLWHSDLPVQRPAIITIWYTPDRTAVDPKTGLRRRHSIVLIVTDRGPIYVDPQVGEIQLSPQEIRSISHRSA